jgi:transforming growth factor-beta-induced protein
VLHSVALAIPVTLCAWTVQAADLIQTAEQVGRFNSFLRVLEATGMADMLKRDGPFTVFAPTDEAFAQLPQGTLDRLWRGTSCSRRLSSRTS